MMQPVTDAAAGTLRDWLALILLGIGVQFPPHQFLGGLFMALAGAAISRAWERERLRRRGCEVLRENVATLLLVAATAFFTATMVAVFVNSHWPEWSVPMVMAAAGFASRRIVYAALNITEGLARRGDRIAQRIIDRFLPGGDGGEPR